MTDTSASTEVAPAQLGRSLCVLRLCVPGAQEQMQLSLARLGQLTPVQAWRVGGTLELFDGIKRREAALALSWPTVRVEVHALDAPGAKARLLRCNASGGLCELEEGWLVRSLYRDDRLTQPQIAQLLARHKSWVCRRLALAEDLSDELTADVRLGLLAATAAAQLARLQRCNQDEAARVAMRRGLTTRQTASLVDALLSAPPEQRPALLAQASQSAPAEKPPPGPRRRTPGEQLCADAAAIKRVCTRLHARLLERSLASLGEPDCGAVGRELSELRTALCALSRTLDMRLGAQGAADAAR